MTGWLGRSGLGPGGRTALSGTGARALGLVLIGLVLIGLAVQVMPFSADAGETPSASGPRALTVAVLDLDAIPALSPPPALASQPTWRTSFGSERVTRREPDVEAASAPLAVLAHTDAVLIHGVKAASPLRRLFPPRSWRLIVSRRLAHTQGSDGRAAGPRGAPPATAIALRARADLRVSARLHAPARHAEAGTPAPAGPRLPPGATAVRIVDRGQALWLVAVTLPSSCHNEGAPCSARDALDAWRDARRADGEATLVAGRLAASDTINADGTETSEPCAAYEIEADLAVQPVPLAGNTGCIAMAQLKN